MLYWIAGLGSLIISLGLFGGGLYVANTYCKAGLYKAQVTALKQQISKARDLAKEARNEEDKDTLIDKTNKDFLHEIEDAIKSSSDNPECASSEFLRKLRNLQ